MTFYRAVLALQACDGALFLVSLDTFLSCASECAAAGGCGRRSQRLLQLHGRR